MTKVLRACVGFLLFRIDWRKLIVVCSILMIVSVFIQISKLPYPLTEKDSPPQSEISSYNPLNTAVYLDKSRSLAVGVQLESIHDTSAIVSLNSSAELDESLVIPNKAIRAFRRKRSNTVSSVRLSPPPLPLTVKKLPRQLERYLLSLTPDETLAFVKRDIKNSSLASDDDPELHAPLFRNISTFKRSYEWMERLLKVYIYQDGEPPIFHQPQLSGIYSSEGWFMKLMEASRQFVTRDPEKAHLFYLPYSARKLQLALYVPNSHNLRPLSIFLRDYVNMLAAKYPFWNRTHGSDHFLVACHDWVW